MHNLNQLHVVVAVLLLGGSQQLSASAWDKSALMTTTEPIVAGDKLLQPGVYVWKLLDSPSNRHIVQISDQKTGRVETTILAIANYRRHVSDKNSFQYWETAKGLPPAVRSWFYPGDNYGQEFAYPEAVMASLAAAQPPATAVFASPVPAAPRAIRKTVGIRHLAIMQSATPKPRNSAASEGSWAAAATWDKPVKRAAVPPKAHASLWNTLKSLPLTATLAPLVGIIGLVSLTLGLMGYLKRKNNHQVAA